MSRRFTLRLKTFRGCSFIPRENFELFAYLMFLRQPCLDYKFQYLMFRFNSSLHDFFFSSFLPPVLVHFRILLSFGQNSVTINDKKDPRWRQMTSSYNKYPILSCRTSYRLSFKRTILKCPSTTMKTPNIGSHHFHARWVMSLHVSHKG